MTTGGKPSWLAMPIRMAIRFCRLLHRSLLPPLVPVAASAQRKRYVLPQPDEAEKAGYRACLRCRPKAIGGNRQTEMVKAVCRYIEQHLDEPITLSRLGSEFRQSPFHLQRSFKAALGISPRAYADSCRMNQLKRNLQAGHSVTRAMYDAGYSSSSRLYERTASQLGMTPDKYRRGAIAAPIRYTCTDSPLGRMLIAATEKGICAIQFADSDDELEHGLKHEFPFAVRRRDDAAMQSLETESAPPDSRPALNSSLPLDIQATAFQRRVWTYLQSIPFGATRSYGKLRRRSDSRPPPAPWLAPAPPTGGRRHSLPPRGPHRWRHGRLSLGNRTQRRLCWNWSTTGSSPLNECTVLSLPCRLQSHFVDRKRQG